VAACDCFFLKCFDDLAAVPEGMVSASSTNGIFLHTILLGFDELSFLDVVACEAICGTSQGRHDDAANTVTLIVHKWAIMDGNLKMPKHYMYQCKVVCCTQKTSFPTTTNIVAGCTATATMLTLAMTGCAVA